MNAASYVDLKTRVMTREELDWVRAQDIEGVAFMAMSKFTTESIHETMALLSEIRPFMCEIRFDRLATIEQNHQMFQDANMALWTNTLNMEASGEWVDRTALIDPDRIWGTLMNAGISVFQTDEPEALKAYLKGHRT